MALLGRTVMKQFCCFQYLYSLLRVCDVQLVQVRLLQAGEVLQTLEAMHGQKRSQLLGTQWSHL